MRKKRILFNSNHSRLLTGFGKNTKNILTYLHKNGYEVLEYASQMVDGSPPLQTLPWQARGALPNDQHILNELNKDQGRARAASYGEYNIENVVRDFEPDVVICSEDYWGIEWVKNKNFFNKIPTIVWVTHDSIPLIGLDQTSTFKNYWTWSNFATKVFHENKYTHIKTQYPPIDVSGFYNLGNDKKKEIRKRFNIPEDSFIVLDVFRNQLRKLQPNQIEGFAQFKKENPDSKAILLLATNFSEGWNIPALCSQYGVDQKDVWAVYVSDETNDYLLHPFIGNEGKCPFSGKEKALKTISITKGVTEEQLNEIYNIADVFSHPASSGACEIPCVEAAAAEKIILTADYSYGEDIIELNKGALKLDWAKYTEIGTQFIKSSPFPYSICKQLKKVYDMTKEKRKELGLKSREWVKENYDLEKNCKQIADFIDSLPFADWENIELDKAVQKNENYQLPENYQQLSDDDFLTLIYKEILLMDESPVTDGHKYWQQAIKNGQSREQIYAYFINVAKEDNRKQQKIEFGSFFDGDSDKLKIAMVMPESLGDLILLTSLFDDLKCQYPNSLLYIICKPEYFDVFEGNEHVYKLVPYSPIFENLMYMEGHGEHKGFVDICYLPHIGTQRILNYLHNGKDKISFNLKYEGKS